MGIGQLRSHGAGIDRVVQQVLQGWRSGRRHTRSPLPGPERSRSGKTDIMVDEVGDLGCPNSVRVA